MQQRQLRLGDTLDDYCPRERRLTNHAVVAMVGDDVKRTRCSTCDTEHEYKHAKIPHQRRKAETPAALYSQVLAGAPKKIESEPEPVEETLAARPLATPEDAEEAEVAASLQDAEALEHVGSEEGSGTPEGPVHRRLIRATLPRLEGAPPPQRPIPEFTIRQPAGGRQNRFRARHGRGTGGGQPFQNGGGGGRVNSGRPQGHGRAQQGGQGRKRSK
jgi:hypothetical protein